MSNPAHKIRRHSTTHRHPAGSKNVKFHSQRAQSDVGERIDVDEVDDGTDGDDYSDEEENEEPAANAEAVTTDEFTAAAAGTVPEPRPTRPLPNSKTRRIPTNANPTLVPVQATVPKTTAQKENTRHLIVVLEHACLEAYRVSSGSASRGGKDGKDAKYALLNCDDHQGILAKTGRDIADARPDITHQVRLH